MTRKQAAEWSTLFLAVLSVGLVSALGADGMDAFQWVGAAAAVLGSVTAAVGVLVWPEREEAKARKWRPLSRSPRRSSPPSPPPG